MVLNDGDQVEQRPVDLKDVAGAMIAQNGIERAESLWLQSAVDPVRHRCTLAGVKA